MRCAYSMDSTKRLGVNTKCFPISLLQGRFSHLYIYLVEKHSWVVVEDMYPGYLIKMTRPNLTGINMSPHYNKMTAE
jgi:hypothetical protein